MPPNPLKTKKKFHSPDNYFRIPLEDLATWVVKVYIRDHKNGTKDLVPEDISEHLHLNHAELDPTEFESNATKLAQGWKDLPWGLLNHMDTGWGSMTVDTAGIMTLDARQSTFSGFLTPGTRCTMADDFCEHLYDFQKYLQRLGDDIGKLYPWDKTEVILTGRSGSITKEYAFSQGKDYDLDLLISVLELWATMYCGIDPRRTTTLRYWFMDNNEASARTRVREYQDDLPERPDYKDTEVIVQIDLPVRVRLIDQEHGLDRENRIVERTFRTLEDIGPDELATIIKVHYPEND